MGNMINALINISLFTSFGEIRYFFIFISLLLMDGTIISTKDLGLGAGAVITTSFNIIVLSWEGVSLILLPWRGVLLFEFNSNCKSPILSGSILFSVFNIFPLPISIWRCGPVEPPVFPEVAIISFSFTSCLTFTRTPSFSKWAYKDSYFWSCSMIIYLP